MIFATILIIPAQSQDQYPTSIVHLFLSVFSNQNIIQKHFDNLKLNIDYENAKAISEINYVKMKDMLDAQLLNSVLDSYTVQFSGDLSLEYIQIQNHSHQCFDIKGMLTIGEHQLQAKGEKLLSHIKTGNAYMQEMDLQNLTAFNKQDGRIQSYEVKFQIIQSLLKINNSNF